VAIALHQLLVTASLDFINEDVALATGSYNEGFGSFFSLENDLRIVHILECLALGKRVKPTAYDSYLLSVATAFLNLSPTFRNLYPAKSSTENGWDKINQSCDEILCIHLI
jgi:hypothetical protein